MPVRPVVLYPDPRLKTRCSGAGETDFADARRVARDLLDTMNDAPPRTVGIAAPQIGEMTRIALVDTSRNPRYPPGHGPLTLIDPIIIRSSGMQVFREGCLSVPEFTANITRALHVRVRYLNLDGNENVIDMDSFEAVVVQHEIDHLDGVLFLDRVKNLSQDLFRRKSGP